MRGCSCAAVLLLAVHADAFSPTGRPVSHLRRALSARPAVQPLSRTAAASGGVPAAAVRTAPPMMADIVTETNLRSAVKAVGWRITAGIVTACTSMIFTGSLATAAAIVGWDLWSKSITMFIGERLWNNVEWGKEGGADSQQRSVAKALAWRLFAACNTLFAAIVLTKGNAGVAGKIAGSDSVVKTLLFYFYERAWAAIGWGKVSASASDDAPAKAD